MFPNKTSLLRIFRNFKEIRWVDEARETWLLLLFIYLSMVGLFLFSLNLNLFLLNHFLLFYLNYIIFLFWNPLFREHKMSSLIFPLNLITFLPVCSWYNFPHETVPFRCFPGPGVDSFVCCTRRNLDEIHSTVQLFFNLLTFTFLFNFYVTKLIFFCLTSGAHPVERLV